MSLATATMPSPSKCAAPILVTGATGFVGAILCEVLVARGYRVLAAVRGQDDAQRLQCRTQVQVVVCGDLSPCQEWRRALAGVGAVVHLAADSRNLHRLDATAVAAYRQVNTESTLNLARQAAAAGVKRFVFVSSVKVMGECSRQPLVEDGLPTPATPYAISKWEAEQGLADLAGRSALEVVVLRPPLVYGPGMRGSMVHLLQAVRRGVPLPLGSVRNRRGFLHVRNLADAIAVCATHAEAANRTYLLDDGETISIPEWLRRFAEAMGCDARLFPFPVPVLQGLGKAFGRGADIDRLTADLEVDSGRIVRELGWRRPLNLDAGIVDTGVWLASLARRSGRR